MLCCGSRFLGLFKKGGEKKKILLKNFLRLILDGGSHILEIENTRFIAKSIWYQGYNNSGTSEA